jgi:RND family efflux transporter MFP subunit
MHKFPFIPPIMILAPVILIAAGAIVVSCHKRTDSHVTEEKTTIYHCPMHPNYLSHQPGTCPICGMNLVPVNKSEPPKEKGKGRILYYWDAMNPSYTSDKPGKAPDGMDLVPVYDGDDNSGAVRIDPAMIQSIGVQTEKAARRTLTRDIRASATVMPDERLISTITTKVQGYVEKLYVNYTGQWVKAGEPLFDIYSPELVNAQTEYLQAFRQAGVSGTSELLLSARRRLLNWDITEAQIADLEKREAPEKTMTIVSPAGGIVTEKMIVNGQSIEPGMQLYKIIDYSRIWIEGAIYQQDVPLIGVGQRGGIELDYYPGEKFSGVVTYVAPELNRESRTLLVRLELANTVDMRIKPGMNALVTIHAVMKRRSITVPDQAVIHSGLRTLVVVSKGGGYFEPREIRTGQTAGGYTEVLSGVGEGDDIVVSSQFLIDSESNLKAAVMKMAGKKEDAGSAPMGNPPARGSTIITMEGMPDMNHPHHDSAAPMKKINKILYTCPMDPEVVSDKPGSCPKCGMNLVPQKTESDHAAKDH